MAEKRKKAKKPAPRRVPAAGDPGERTWVARDEALFFPAETPNRGEASRISLPSSGLAEDILARAEAASVESSGEAAASTDLAVLETAPTPTAPDVASRVHNISFFAAPAREEKKAAEAQEHLVTFFLAREEYGIDVRLVQEIIRVAEITPVPRAPAAIKGVINLRGRIIPVIDLKRRLGLGEVESTRVARVVVVQAQGPPGRASSSTGPPRS